MKKLIALITLITSIGTLAADEQPEVNPLKDYVLVGISPLNEGFRITILDRNDLEKRIIVDSSRPSENSEFRVISVNRVEGEPLSTTLTRLSLFEGFERPDR